jgi:hypothetical protein
MAFLIRKIGLNPVKKRCPEIERGYRAYGRISFLQAFRISLLVVIGLVLSVRAVMADAETESNLEYRIKAAFLLNFCQFVSWPVTPQEKPDASLILCVIGESPFKSSLETIAGKTVRGRTMEVRFVSNMDAISPCHLLFVGKSEQKNLAAIIASLKNKPILTVGDMEDFARCGGIIAFVKIDNKIRFEINPKAAETVGLKISSQLLKLAIIAE